MTELTGDGASRDAVAHPRTTATHIPTVAADIMSTPVFTVPASASVEEIAEVLGRHQISAVPVVDESGHVLGVVSEYDVLAKPGRSAAEVMSTGVVALLTTEWVCRICGEPTRGLDPPESCPTCGGTGAFILQEQRPGP